MILLKTENTFFLLLYSSSASICCSPTLLFGIIYIKSWNQPKAKDEDPENVRAKKKTPHSEEDVEDKSKTRVLLKTTGGTAEFNLDYLCLQACVTVEFKSILSKVLIWQQFLMKKCEESSILLALC